MALDNLQIDYLIDPAFQIENLAGKPAVGGHIEVFEAGTDTKVITYQDFDGNVNPFKIPLHSDGRAVILADPSRKYDLYVYDSFNNLMFSRLNVTPNLSGNISITGSDVVIYNTDGTLDITQQSIQNNVRRYEINTKHKSFGVKEPLYFVEDSESATIIGCRSQTGDYATTAYVESVISGKLDISSYSSQSGNFLTDKFEYDDNNHITAYNHSAFAGGGANYEAGDHIDITDNVISVTGLPDIENAITSAITNVENKFEYNENNYITAYNNSAFAGKEYSAGDYVSIENDTISVTGLQPSGDYATKTDLSGKQDTLSAGDGISIVNNIISVTSQGGGIEQVNHDDTLSGNGNDEPLGIANIEDFVKHNDLTAYQEKGDYYSASNPSGFITNDALTGLQPSGDYVTRDELTAYQPSGNYATIEDVESAVSGKQDILSAGEGIQIINNTISVTAQGGGGGGITVVNHDNTLSGNGNSTPLGIANAEDYVKQDDLTGYQPSGDYYSASNPSGFITSDDLTGYATTSLVSSVSSELYSAFSGISGDFELVAGSGVELIDDPTAKTTTINVTAQGGNPEVEAEVIAHSADWNTVGDKLDTTAFSTVSGDFLTAHQDISNLMPKSESANFYPMTGNPSMFLTAVPTGTMNESAFEYDTGNKISGYNGSAFAGGSEIPTTVSGYWQTASDTVSANSGAWGGSALPISAGPGIKLELVNDTLVASTDETVLFETNDVYGAGVCNLSESLKNFERVAVKPTRGYNGTPNPGGAGPWNYFDTDQIVGGTDEPFQAVCPFIMEYLHLKISQYNPNADCTVLTWKKGYQKNMQDNGFASANSFTACIGIQKVIGINRIAGGN